jgi:DNA-directed RNA polymerase specialized sigma24 family protein
MGDPPGLATGARYEDSTVLAEPLAFETFFETEARSLFRRLCIVTGNSAEAEEVVQDAFLALWERWDRAGGSKTRPGTSIGPP